MLDGADEAALQAFLSALPAAHAVPVRTLAHSWQAAGGTLQVGRVTIRLCATGRDGRPFTAATLHASLGGDRPAARSADLRTGPGLEVARVLLANHGLGEADWRSWCDDLADLQLIGFDAAAKYPSIALDVLPEAAVARLAQSLRDLGRLAQGQAA
jgi:hypothetical protein